MRLAGSNSTFFFWVRVTHTMEYIFISENSCRCVSEKPTSGKRDSWRSLLHCRQLHQSPPSPTVALSSLLSCGTFPSSLLLESASGFQETMLQQGGKNSYPTSRSVSNLFRVLHLAVQDTTNMVFTATHVWVPLRLSGQSVPWKNVGQIIWA